MGSPVVFEFSLNLKSDPMMGGKTYNWSIYRPGSSPSHPDYTSTFKSDGLSVLKQPQIVTRNIPNHSQICQAKFHDEGISVNVEHPWKNRGRVVPEHGWKSDIGSLSGRTLVWVYNWTGGNTGKKDGSIIRCHFKDDEQWEVCRITFPADGKSTMVKLGLSSGVKGKLDHGRIEIPAGIIRSQEDADEIVSDACVQLLRRTEGWDVANQQDQAKQAAKVLKETVLFRPVKREDVPRVLSYVLPQAVLRLEVVWKHTFALRCYEVDDVDVDGFQLLLDESCVSRQLRSTRGELPSHKIQSASRKIGCHTFLHWVIEVPASTPTSSQRFTAVRVD
nr:hypothetical protein CFP56_70111 [Quercus suber]